jgi:hypothetical protein
MIILIDPECIKKCNVGKDADLFLTDQFPIIRISSQNPQPGTTGTWFQSAAGFQAAPPQVSISDPDTFARFPE